MEAYNNEGYFVVACKQYFNETNSLFHCAKRSQMNITMYILFLAITSHLYPSLSHSLSLRGWPIELHQTQWEINETEHVPFFRFGTCSLLLYLYLPREVGLLMFGSPYTCFQSWKGSFIQLSWQITWNKCWGCCFIRIFSKNVYTPCIIAFRI